jgi:hypothetical protein
MADHVIARLHLLVDEVETDLSPGAADIDHGETFVIDGKDFSGERNAHHSS